MNTSPTSSPVMRCYAPIKRTLAPGTPLVILHIGAEQAVVLAEAPGQAPVTQMLAIGEGKTAREYFRHEPPSPLEMEQAIAAVEEEVMPLRAVIADGSTPYTGFDTHDIAALAGTSGNRLSIEHVEALFNRLAAISEGRPATQENLPRSKDFFASVLILREFMHHLGFASTGLCPRG